MTPYRMPRLDFQTRPGHQDGVIFTSFALMHLCLLTEFLSRHLGSSPCRASRKEWLPKRKL
jgi:hypothetical protein